MSIIEERHYEPLAYEEDSDDYRPDSELAVVLDPSNTDGDFVEGLAVFCERFAPGDRIPLHQHTVDERKTVGPGSTIFIPDRAVRPIDETAFN